MRGLNQEVMEDSLARNSFVVDVVDGDRKRPALTVSGILDRLGAHCWRCVPLV
jgi:hypothetical protein